MSRMVKMGIVNDSSKFDNQMSSYNRDAGFEILCFVGGA